MVSRRLVSLGNDCTAAYQLRRYSGQRESGIFDWLITPPAALDQQINTDFADFFQRENLRVRDGGDGVLDTANGIIHHHAFGRDEHGAVTEAHVEAEYATVRSKYDHLIGKWRALERFERLCFARATRSDDQGAEPLFDLLCRRFGGADVSLLFFRRGLPVRVEQRGKVLLFDVGEDAGVAPDFWQGDDDNWDRALRLFVGQMEAPATAASGAFD